MLPDVAKLAVLFAFDFARVLVRAQAKKRRVVGDPNRHSEARGSRMLGHHLGHWFSELTPNGHFRDVPVDADRFAIDESVATDLIDLIRNGQSLPRHIIRLLPEIPKWDYNR